MFSIWASLSPTVNCQPSNPITYLWCDKLCSVPAAQRCVSMSLALLRARTRADIIWGEFMMAWRLASFFDSWCTIKAACPVTTCIQKKKNHCKLKIHFDMENVYWLKVKDEFKTGTNYNFKYLIIIIQQFCQLRNGTGAEICIILREIETAQTK